MAEVLPTNEWTVSGEVIYLKDLQGEFSASVKLRGVSKREGAFSSQVLEFPCLMQDKLYEKAKKKGLGLYKNATLSGHLESWQKNKNGKDVRKVMFVVDYVLDVG